MKYQYLSKFKELIGIGIVLFYLLEIPQIPINNTVLTMGLLILIWCVFEDYYYLSSEIKIAKYFTLIADIIIFALLLFFFIKKIVEKESSAYTLTIQCVIVLLFSLWIVNLFIKIIQKTHKK